MKYRNTTLTLIAFFGFMLSMTLMVAAVGII